MFTYTLTHPTPPQLPFPSTNSARFIAIASISGPFPATFQTVPPISPEIDYSISNSTEVGSVGTNVSIHWVPFQSGGIQFSKRFVVHWWPIVTQFAVWVASQSCGPISQTLCLNGYLTNCPEHGHISKKDIWLEI